MVANPLLSCYWSNSLLFKSALVLVIWLSNSVTKAMLWSCSALLECLPQGKPAITPKPKCLESSSCKEAQIVVWSTSRQSTRPGCSSHLWMKNTAYHIPNSMLQPSSHHITATPDSVPWRNPRWVNTGYQPQIAEVYQKEKISVSPGLHLPIHRKTVNSLTWDICVRVC